MLGHHRYDSETPFKWRFAGGPMLVRLWWYLDPFFPHQLKKRCHSWTLSEKRSESCACSRSKQSTGIIVSSDTYQQFGVTCVNFLIFVHSAEGLLSCADVI